MSYDNDLMVNGQNVTATVYAALLTAAAAKCINPHSWLLFRLGIKDTEKALEAMKEWVAKEEPK